MYACSSVPLVVDGAIVRVICAMNVAVLLCVFGCCKSTMPMGLAPKMGQMKEMGGGGQRVEALHFNRVGGEQWGGGQSTRREAGGARMVQTTTKRGNMWHDRAHAKGMGALGEHVIYVGGHAVHGRVHAHRDTEHVRCARVHGRSGVRARRVVVHRGHDGVQARRVEVHARLVDENNGGFSTLGVGRIAPWSEDRLST